MSYEDRKKVTVFIQDILGKYNEYTRSLMSTGENVLYEKLISDNNEIKNMLSDMANKVNKDNLAKFYEAVETSKSIGLANIDCLINDEYEIDRTAIVEKIKKENCAIARKKMNILSRFKDVLAVVNLLLEKNSLKMRVLFYMLGLKNLFKKRGYLIFGIAIWTRY